MPKPVSLLLPLLLVSFFEASPAAVEPELPPLAELPTPGELPEEFQERMAAAHRHARENPEDAESVGVLGMSAHAHHLFAFAEQCYRRARFLDPGELRWAYYLGEVLARQGRPLEAAEAFQEASRLDPGFRPARMRWAESLFEAGQAAEAGHLFEELLEDRPRAARAHYGLGRVRAAEGDVESAVRRFEKAVELFSRFGSAHYALGLLRRDEGETEAAREHMLAYRRHPRSGPPSADPLMDAVRALRTGAGVHLERGIRAEEEGRLDEAVQEHLRALELLPDLTQARVNLIILYGRTGRHDKAEQQYYELLERNPEVADGHYNYGRVLMEQHRFEEAAEAFRRVLQVNPDHALAHNNLGFLSEIDGGLREAEEHYRRALRNDPGLRRARFNLGRILANRGRFEEAIEQIGRTLSPEDEETPRYLYGLAAAYVHSGDAETGVRYARRALQMASELEQHELAARIEENLRELEERRSH